MVGDEASKLRSMLEVNYPMENGIVRYVLLHIYILIVLDYNNGLRNFVIFMCVVSEIGMTCAMFGIIPLDQKR